MLRLCVLQQKNVCKLLYIIHTMWCLFALVSLQFSVVASYVSAERLKACGTEKRYRSARYQTLPFDKGRLLVFDKGAQRQGQIVLGCWS